MKFLPTLASRHRLILLLSLLLSAAFFATTLLGYFVSKQAIRAAIIGQDLPLTSSNIYSEIQKDLVRPVLVSSTMAHDTFLRDWVLKGENNVSEMARFLEEVKVRHGAFSSFFVSEKTGNYYTSAGIAKKISPTEQRDAWYYRVRAMKEDYEINVDRDMINRDALTIFVNYRVFDFAGNYIGATGIGLTVDAVYQLINSYQQRFQRTIYFVDTAGREVLLGDASGARANLRQRPGLGAQMDQILKKSAGSYQFTDNGDNHILNVNYLSELKWYLFVEQNEDLALAGVRNTLYANLAISLLVTLIVIFLTYLTLNRYHAKIETMASTDKLTGLLNRHAFSILIDKLLASYRRKPQAITMLLADIDHFKAINDRYGHRVGDEALVSIAASLKNALRDADFAVRWGGEEFLIVLQNCPLEEGQRIAEKLRQAIETTSPCPSEPAIKLTISIGVSQFNGHESPEQTINRADSALYTAKAEGRNRVCRTA
ncbi:MAG: GGDEF domain-containing protein [Betaproteobacteria bacterium HGW-Betaproteobacteria-10]|nr:MAG: GGDEF domain-containing protein [Betaproteobacteria bacterium HGW-Betaproteobacteria-10]